MTITTTVTDLPTSPDRTQPATFSDRADAWVSALGDLTTEINSVAGEMNDEASAAASSAATAILSEAAALGAANYKGAWGDLTGALALPASATHDGALWLLTEALADVTTSEPGVSGDWIQLTGAGVNYQEFTSSGTWTKPALCNYVMVEAIAGGGGGRRDTSGEAHGGTGGEFVRQIFRASECGATETVTIGAGGLGSTASIDGGDGGDTTFGSLLTATGGPGGHDGTNDFAGLPRNGRSASSVTFDINILEYLVFPQAGMGFGETFKGGNTIYGGAGGGGATGSGAATSGGVSEFGGNGGRGRLNGNGDDGTAPGGGGGGAINGDGGDGAEGRVRVYTW